MYRHHRSCESSRYVNVMGFMAMSLYPAVDGTKITRSAKRAIVAYNSCLVQIDRCAATPSYVRYILTKGAR